MVKVQYKHVLTAIVPMSMYLFAPLARILFVEKKKPKPSAVVFGTLYIVNHGIIVEDGSRWILLVETCHL